MKEIEILSPSEEEALETISNHLRLPKETFDVVDTRIEDEALGDIPSNRCVRLRINMDQFLEVIRQKVQRILEGDDYTVEAFEDGYILFRKGKGDALSRRVLQYMRENRKDLMKNHFRPYRDRLLPEPMVGRDVYSPRQLAPASGKWQNRR